MKLQIAIIEDNEAEQASLAAMLEGLSTALAVKLDIRTFSSAEAFLFEHGENNIYDILLLDVEMGAVSGIELAKHIRGHDKRAEIIFITSHFELMSEGYEVDARHFLVKPLGVDKLKAVLSRSIAHLSIEPPYVMIKADGDIIKLPTDKIVYVEAFLHYLSVHTEEGEYRIKESLSAFAEQLGDGFFRAHRSYLVALNRIVRISRTEITLDVGKVLPISRGLYDAINRAFIEWN